MLDVPFELLEVRCGRRFRRRQAWKPDGSLARRDRTFKRSTALGSIACLQAKPRFDPQRKRLLPLCKQEVTGSNPGGSTRERPASRLVPGVDSPLAQPDPRLVIHFGHQSACLTVGCKILLVRARYGPSTNFLQLGHLPRGWISLLVLLARRASVPGNDRDTCARVQSQLRQKPLLPCHESSCPTMERRADVLARSGRRRWSAPGEAGALLSARKRGTT
jgi:hypothetical protein